MYTLICRLCHQLHRFPKTVLLFAILITGLASHYALKLEIKTSLVHVLPSSYNSVKLLDRMEKEFGGLGKLTVVLTSDSPAQTESALLELVENLKTHPDVNLLDYKKERTFFEQNKLLYIKLEDLSDIQKRIEAGLWAQKEKYNPLLVDLLDSKEKEDVSLDHLSFHDLEEKYFPKLQKYHGSSDGNALILHIFPRFDIKDVLLCKSFYTDVRTAVSQVSNLDQINIHYTGEVLNSIQEEGRLLNEIIDSGWLSVCTILLLIILFFFRVPLGPFFALVPLAMGIIWTLALAYLFIGYLSMVTLSLGIILFGLGLDSSLHLLSRYKEERRKNLSANIAFDTIILETGPAVFTSIFTSAAAFFSITITDFQGFSEFGLMAGTGILCTGLAILVVFPCILILLEPMGCMPVFGKRIMAFNHFKRVPYTKININIAIFCLLSGLLLYKGFQTEYEYNFKRLGFPNFNSVADSIVQTSGEAITSPTVVMTPNAEEALKVSNHLRRIMETDSLSPTIHSVISLPDLLPRDQKEKLTTIEKIKKLVTPELMAKAPEDARANFAKLQESWDVSELTINDLPESFRKKFMGRSTESAYFTYIFPSVNLSDGLNCMAFAEDTREITMEHKTYYTSGIAVIYADLLKLMIPDTLKAIGLCLLTLFILVLLHTRSLRGTAILFLPVVIGIMWTLGAMKIFGLKLNYFNLVAFPAIIGIGIDNGVHLYHRYLEEGLGSLYFVLSRTGNIVTMTSITSIAGFFGFVFSSHRGLFSLGVTAVLGITLTLVSSLVVVLAILGWTDRQRFKRSKKYGHKLYI